MGFFRKRKPNVVDFTSASRRAVPEVSNSSKLDNGVVDFSSASSQTNNSISSSPNMDFLSNLAGADNSSSGSVTDSLRNARQKNQMSQELNEMKLKLDDNDFKLNSVVEKVKELEMKLRERGI